jgi:hypothetical protein
MKITFNDSETKRLLSEFAAVLSNRIAKTKSSSGAIRTQNKTVKEYSKKINGWVLTKIDVNYKSKIVRK